MGAWLLPRFLCTTAFHAGPAAAAERSPVQLTVAGLSYGAARRLSEQGLNEFTRKTGISLNSLPAWGNSTDQLAVARNTLRQHLATPDVYVIDAIWPGSLAEHLLDLRSYLTKEQEGQLPELMENDTVRGRVVGLPFYLNVGMLYYRSDLLKKYGYRQPPATWDELEKMAAAIQKGERQAGHPAFWGYVWQGGAYEGLTCNALEWQVSYGGGKVIEPDGRVSVNNAYAAQALRMAARWIGSISPASVLSYTEADSLNAFRSGNAAFLRYWSSGYAPVQEDGSAVRNQFKIALLPGGPRGRAQTMGGFQIAVSRYSSHGRESSELAKFLTSAPVQKARAIEDGYLPTIPRLYDDPQLLKAVPPAAALRQAGLAQWVARPSSIAGNAYAEVSRAYFQAVHSVLSGQAPVAQALAGAEKQIVSIMRSSHSSGK